MHLLRAQLQCACFDLTARYGRWLYGLKLCRVRRIQNADGAIFFQKTRFRRSRILVGAGNLFLKLSGGDLFGLSERQWLGWEQKMAPISSRQCVRVRGRSLLTPLIAGESLAQI